MKLQMLSRIAFGLAIVLAAVAFLASPTSAMSGFGNPDEAVGSHASSYVGSASTYGGNHDSASSLRPALINEGALPSGVSFSKKRVKYVEGYPDGTFRPDGAVMRAEVAAMICRLMAEGENDAQYVANFIETSGGAWYRLVVTYVQINGIMIGDDDGDFRPEAHMSRSEFATMMSRFAAPGQAMPIPQERFVDVPLRHWAAAQIEACAANGWILGYTDGMFHPDKPITRAEAVAILNRALGRSEGEGEGEQGWNTKASVPIYTDLDEGHWAFQHIMDASVPDLSLDSDGYGDSAGNNDDSSDGGEIRTTFEEFLLECENEHVPGELLVAVRETTDAQAFISMFPEIDVEFIVYATSRVFYISLVDKSEESLYRAARLFFMHPDVTIVSPNGLLYYYADDATQPGE